MSQNGIKGEKISLGQIISYKSAITFTFDLKTLFKVIANLLLKSPLYVKNEPKGAMRRTFML